MTDRRRQPPHLRRREFLKAGAVTVASGLLPASCAEAPWEGAPDVLLILTDDQHFRAVGYASDGQVITPHIDRLADRGTTFNAAYCNAMPCTPSRGVLLSGLHRHRWRKVQTSEAARLRPGEWTWAHALQAANYSTSLIGKMHMAPMRADHGFEHAEYCEHNLRRVIAPGNSENDDYQMWLSRFGVPDRQEPGVRIWPYDEKYHAISWIRDRAIATLERPRREGEPRCMTVSFRHPHSPFEPGRSFAELYDPADMEIPSDSWDDMDRLPSKLWLWGDAGWYPRYHYTEEFLRKRFAYYFALVSQIDDAIGSILEHVDMRRTLVLFTSDHGMYMGNRGRVGKHPYLHFDPVGRVPFVAAGHGVPRGETVEHPVGLVDLAPTFLTAAGLPVPDDLDGIPLQYYFQDPDYGADRALFAYGESDFNMTRRGAHKYFRSHDGREEMLFDLSTDPGEVRNLAGDSQWGETQASLASAMDAAETRGAPRLRRFPSRRA
jgi:arylsulfatase A-like enzyme